MGCCCPEGEIGWSFPINRKNAGPSGPVFVLFAVFAFTGLVFVLGNGYNRGEKIPEYVHISVYTGLPEIGRAHV